MPPRAIRDRIAYRSSSVCPINGSEGAEVTAKVYGSLPERRPTRAAFPWIALRGSRWQSGGVAENIAPDRSYFTIPELVERFALTPGKLRRLIEDHHLAAVRIDGVLMVPVEFVQDDHPLPSLRGTLLALLDAGFSDDEAMDWLFEVNDELGERPVDSLVAGRKSAVRRATQSLAF